MVDHTIFLSIIIPAYNEDQNIFSTLLNVFSFVYVHWSFISVEIIVIDDGSNDDTHREIIKAYQQARSKYGYINFTVQYSGNLMCNYGKGQALKKGFELASGNFVLFMDADNSATIEEVKKLINNYTNDISVVIGSRKLPESIITIPQPRLRKLMSFFYCTFFGSFIYPGIKDFNCGFKLFKYNSIKTISPRMKITGWGTDAEILFLCKKFGFKVKEVPIIWEHKKTSKVKPLSASIQSIKDLISLYINNIRGYYD